MIRIFGRTDTQFLSNGDCVVSPLKAKVHKKDNGDYFLDFEVGLEYIDYFVEGNIVVANTPTGDQAFRIGNVTKNKNRLVSKCFHVFYDSKNYLIADSYVVEKNCNDALEHLNNATEPQSEFQTISDIQTVDSYRCVRKSLYEAIQEVIARWGGHLVRDNFVIAVRQSIGTDNGIVIQYKKNLKDISCHENWTAVCTKILPVGRDGILLNAVDPSASIYVESETQYELPYTKTVTFQQNIDKAEYESETAYLEALVEDLHAQAVAYLEANCVPQVNYTLKANLDRVTDIGDVVEVIDERLGINMMTHVIGYVYDCIFEKYSEVEFGTFSNTLSGLVGNMTATAEKVASEASQGVQDQIIGMMTNSYVVYDGNKILIVDSLPKESATDVITIDHTGIGFSQNGISGAQTSKWSIDGELTLQQSLTLLDTLSAQSVAINGQNIEDFIKSKGVTSGWTWRKYASGIIEMWKQITIDSANVSWSALGSFNQGSSDVTYPFNVAYATIQATMNSCPDNGWIASAGATDNTKTSLNIIREGTTGSMTVNLYVKGIEPS